MEYILRYSLESEDIEFLNYTSIDYDLHTPNSMALNDSGWRDMNTGGYIINKNDRVIFKNVSASELTFLTLKFGSRLKPLHSGMREIYNVGEQHNTGPNSVIDSEMII